jgi:hypothetical protein
LVAAGVAAGCGGAPDPVARLESAPSRVTLPYPGYADLELVLEPLSELDAAVAAARPVVFVHLLAEPGDVRRTFDHPLAARWLPGVPRTLEVRLYQSALAPPLAAGRYSLSVGLYQPGGERWALETAGREVGSLEYLVAEVEAPSPPGNGVRFDFSPGWRAPESGTDRQVLARRWLAGPGVIRVSGVQRGGVVWMVMRIPSAEDPGARLVLAEGADETEVLITVDCGAAEAHVAGAGVHDIELPLYPEAGADSCQIRFQPNFHQVLEDTFERRSVVLEVLSWRPGSSPPTLPPAEPEDAPASR